MARISVHLPKEVADWVSQIAKKERRSLSQAASILIQNAYDYDQVFSDSKLSEIIKDIQPPSTPLTQMLEKDK